MDPMDRLGARHGLCQFGRLAHAMAARGIDGLVVTQPLNLYYMTGFHGIAHKSDEPRPYALVWSRHVPEHPILITADYYFSPAVARAGWIEDIRPFRAVMMPIDRAPQSGDLEYFLPADMDADRKAGARQNFAFGFGEAIAGAFAELGLNAKAIGFDDMGLGFRLGYPARDVRDAYDCLMFARAVKRPAEIALLERATALNEQAIRRTMADWSADLTWREMDRAYASHVQALGGFVRDPGGMVWGHPRGSDSALVLSTGQDDGAVGEGTHVMFDCHGTLDLYCWDGGKTWVAGGEPEGLARDLDRITSIVAQEMLQAMKPGVSVSQLQTKGRETYRKAGAPDADSAVIFFHGLGLSHMDVEQSLADGRPNGDWVLEEGMVVPLHLLYPGGANERIWLEEVAVIGPDGGRPLFGWGFDVLTG